MVKESDLIKAVKQNDQSKLQKLLTDPNIVINTPDPGKRIRLQLNHLDINCHEKGSEYTPLIIAALNGNVACAEALIFHSADVNATDSKGNTALHMAVFSLNTEMVDLYIENSAQINLMNNDGDTALHIACRSDIDNNISLLMKLVDAGADTECVNRAGQSPMDMLAIYNRKKALSVLLDYNPSLRSNTHSLTEAAIRGNHEVAELLLDYGIDPNCVYAEKQTAPLHEAVRFNRYKVAEVLLAFGASSDMKNNKNETPESLAKDQLAAVSVEFFKLFEAYKNVAPRIPRFVTNKGLTLDKQVCCKGVPEFPLIPNKSRWTENTPTYCSTCTEKNTNLRILDNNPHTYWVIPVLHHAWTVLNLQEEYIISGITVFGWNSPQMVKTVELQWADNVKGPWSTFTTITCDQEGSSDPQDPGVPQTFCGFEMQAQFLRLYIQDNHGGSCICFQGIQLHGAQCALFTLLEKCGLSQYSRMLAKKGFNTIQSLLNLKDEDIGDMIFDPVDSAILSQRILQMRREEFPLTSLEWLREPVSRSFAGDLLPDFSVQSNAGACDDVELFIEGAEFSGTPIVRLAPLFEEEGSVAIFSDIRIKTGWYFKP
ncbi:uncharacterized protein LOC121368321 isoform X2 [Gigantopelta aegis]|uniref:uncharacterized protein LOC121368321 isoform X2 n=1 Tax=Gigantopelta aegis TaxID=1735272 RepID=UPI001B889C96|nr:uncharacterized protein LOC121368321 isoform X2 [Gigantopelta aegis]